MFKKLKGSTDGKTSPSSPLYYPDEKLSVSDTVENIIKLGMPPEKIMLGLAIYGYSYTLASFRKNQIGSAIIGPGKVGKVKLIIFEFFF